MNIAEEEINPLDISFSNEKGFEPSTPSQTSPPKERNNPNLHIRNPFELFEAYPAKHIYPQRHFTPPSRNVQLEVSKFSTSKKENRKK